MHVIRARDVNAPLPETITPLNRNGIRPDPTKGDLSLRGERQFNQRQFFIGFNIRLSRALTISGNYSLSKSTNDDGGGNLFPVNSYDTSGEYRQARSISGTASPFRHDQSAVGKVVLNPFIVANTGQRSISRPGRISTSIDRQMKTELRCQCELRRSDPSSPIKCTRFGNFNLVPCRVRRSFLELRRAPIVCRNLRIAARLRLSQCVAPARPASQAAPVLRTAKRGAGGPGGPMLAGGGAGPTKVAAGGRGGGRPAGASQKRFNLNVSVASNLLNHVNWPPVGNLSSPDFDGRLLGLFGGFGGSGVLAREPRIYAQLRLNLTGSANPSSHKEIGNEQETSFDCVCFLGMCNPAVQAGNQVNGCDNGFACSIINGCRRYRYRYAC